MKIIQTIPNPSGAYPAPHTWNNPKPPTGYAYFPAEFEADFYEYNGFVTLTIVDDKLVKMEPNIPAWEKWKEEQPDVPPPEPEPSTSEIQYALEILLGGHDDELDSIISEGT